MSAVKLNILRIAFPLVENRRYLSEMSTWVEVGPTRSIDVAIAVETRRGQVPAAGQEL
ncbi:hypothetical protein ACFFWD_43135 [Bradyrhizobium erythrophlei]|uniref:hypothetical protein n=1 Tax=Bradyrhizobium erythrophlei TaxID=1437360 RepID=UPI0035E6CCCB